MNTYTNFLKNNLKFVAILGIYSFLLIAMDLIFYETITAVVSSALIWAIFLFRNKEIVRNFQPMILPACLVVSAMSAFSLFRFSEGLKNDAGAVYALIALAIFFAFAIWRAVFARIESPSP